MIELGAFLTAFAGFLSLALAMRRHEQQLCHHTLSDLTRQLLRLAGFVGLTASLALCVARSGWAVGPVLWLGLLTLAALSVVALLTWPLQGDRSQRDRRG